MSGEVQMNNLYPIEKNNMRVLTTTQLAEQFGVDKQLIINNFNRNKERYTYEKHYFALEGLSKNEFINLHQIDLGSKNAKTLYLWTEKGAWLQAKSLNTDEAWDAYEMLVDDYYTKQQQIKVLSEREQLIASMKMAIEMSEEMATVKQDVETLKKDVANRITLDHAQQRSIENAKAARVYYLWENSLVNKDVHDTRKKVFAALGRELKNAFAVSSYKDIKEKDFQEAINFIKGWRPRLV
jgi:hypothetical protein